MRFNEIEKGFQYAFLAGGLCGVDGWEDQGESRKNIV